ncbi:MAG: nucleotidyltransferase family protein [Candidatus Micrarchaeota archaeon]
MKTFILAGGEGTRLRPYTYETPKPMLPIGDEQKPILFYVVKNLKKAGLSDFLITTGYLHEKIEAYFGNGSKFEVKIEYSVEKERLNTAGSILPLKSKVDSTFVVVMGDHVTNIDMKEMIGQHKKGGCIATLALLRGKIPIEYGVAKVKNGAVVEFQEKPMIENLYNVAIYVFEPEIFDYIKEKEDFAKDVFPRLLKSKKKINAYIFEKAWYDIGRVVDYERLNKELKMAELYK